MKKIIIIGVVILAILSVSFLSFNIAGQAKELPITPTPTVVESSPTPKPTEEPKIEGKSKEVKGIETVVYPTSTPIPTSIPIQNKSDSSIHIELCKTKAETHKTQVMTGLVLIYNQNNADAVKIADTSSVEQLVNVGISVGLITREQYNSDPSGHQLALLKTREKIMAEINSFMGTVNVKGDMTYNDYYTRCLNNENE